MNRKLLTAAVMCATALSTISTPAFAAVTVLGSISAADATAATLATMDEACTNAAAGYDTGNGDIWTGTVVVGDVTLVSGPTEVGSHTFAGNGVGEQTGAGTFTPAHKTIVGDPYRNGGSPNMFGMQAAVGGAYSNSSYDFEGDFASTYAHAFSCDISVQVKHPGDPAIAPDGWYTNPGHPVWEGDINLTICANGDGHPYGSSYGQCVFHPGPYQAATPDTWGPDTFVANVPQTAINQDQTDEGVLAHESFGEGFSTSETMWLGQAVVCISPGKKGGTWTKQNGYTGDKCTTTWYNNPASFTSNVNTGSHNWVTIPVI